MFGNSINIFNLEENKVTTNLNQYPMILMSLSGDGKTTTMNTILRQIAPEGKVPLFLMFEDRYQHIPGIMAVRIHNMGELQAVVQQLLTPQGKEKFSCVCIDTLDKASDLISQYVANNKNVEIVADVTFGKGNQYVKSAGSFINDLKNYGYNIAYVVQADKTVNFATGKNEIAPKVNKELWKTAYTDAYLCGFLQVDPIKGTRTITFKKTLETPLLKDSIGMPDKVEIDKFSEVLLESIKKMSGGQLTDEDTIVTHREDTRDFAKLKQQAKDLGSKLYENGLGADCQLIMNQTLGSNEDGSPRQFESIIEAQIDLMEVLVLKLQEFANKKGIK